MWQSQPVNGFWRDALQHVVRYSVGVMHLAELS
jgi:hypothetical protein